MSAEVLRRAATALRDEWADSDGNPRPMGTAWHRERDFHLAVADWLEDEATRIPEWATHYGPDALPIADAPAVRVARMYLGEQS